VIEEGSMHCTRIAPARWGGGAPTGEAAVPRRVPAIAQAAERFVLRVIVVALVAGAAVAPVSARAGPPPESFARQAAAARAASIEIHVPEDDALDDLDLPDAVGALRERTLGAGVIVDPSGIALTSARAVLRVPEFEVVTGDGVPLEATLLAFDRKSDIAVLKLKNGAGVFPYLPLGDSDRVEPGDWVIAIGAPQGFPGTVTVGVVTAKPALATADPLGNLLQTDALKGRGNAGAAVVNLRGEIVGIGTALGGDPGYARPSNFVRKIYAELRERGRVSRPWLGATTQSLTAELARALGAPDDAGVVISDVLPGGPAVRAGLRPGDIVLALDARPVSSRGGLEGSIDGLTPGRVVKLTVRRQGRTMTVRLALAEEPDDWQDQPALVRARRLLGVAVEPFTPSMGAVVVRVDAPSAAAFLGVKPGDVIREVNRRPIATIEDFRRAVPTLRIGVPALVLIQRGDFALYVVLVPEDAG
jgi:serine protease Do